MIRSSGCGGATVGKALAERGYSVVIVEKGGYWTKADFDQREAHALAKIDGGRGLHTSVDGATSLTYGNNVGGASVHYWADSYRTHTDRLDLWADRYGLQGHQLADLVPHFERIERDLNVHLAEPKHINRMNQLVHSAATDLGWQPKKVPQARKDCVGSGFCMQGCSYDAKQSQLVTHIAKADQLGARIYSDLRASQLHLLRKGSRLTGLTAQVLDRATGQPNGKTVRIHARAVVVAAGGYGTPAFLMEQGIHTQQPALGQNLFSNPCPMVHARFEEDIIQWRNIPAAWAVEHFRLAEFDDAGTYVQGGYLLMPNQLQPAMLSAVLPGFGASHRSLMRDLPRMGGTIAWIDDAEAGHVTLEGGRPRYKVPVNGPNGLRIRDAWKKQATLLFQAGAVEVLFGDVRDTRITDPSQVDAAVAAIDLRPSRNVLAAPHPGGAARMGPDPRTSVVGFDHRVHGTDTRCIADPRGFPTAPSVDPSLTIMAFSYVAAEHVHALLG